MRRLVLAAAAVAVLLGVVAGPVEARRNPLDGIIVCVTEPCP